MSGDAPTPSPGGLLPRRRFLGLGLAGGAAWLAGCGSTPTRPEEAGPVGGHLSVRWKAATQALAPGTKRALGLGVERDGHVRVPSGYRPDVPTPLALLLHGAGRNADEWVGGYPVFDELGLAVLSVDSRGSSWDLRYGGFGPDVRFIDEALGVAFDWCNVDPTRLAVAGFSDGASYALSLGLTNGDLFTRVLAFSPGFMETDGRRGKPPVFLSHGTSDAILPVAFTRALEAELRADGYPVTYEEFEGGHVLPYAVGQRGFAWFVHGA